MDIHQKIRAVHVDVCKDLSTYKEQMQHHYNMYQKIYIDFGTMKNLSETNQNGMHSGDIIIMAVIHLLLICGVLLKIGSFDYIIGNVNSIHMSIYYIVDLDDLARVFADLATFTIKVENSHRGKTRSSPKRWRFSI
jgi:hypothetical protein